MSTITVTIPGNKIPTDYTKVIGWDDRTPFLSSELTGPSEGFEFRDCGSYDKVKVIKPDLVEIKTFKKAL